MRHLAAIVLVFFLGEASLAARNVVLFIADDMSQDAGCYGNDVIRTPNIDRLAATGTRYRNAFCTSASCSPSRAVIMTGLHSHANGQLGLSHAAHNFHSRDSVETLPVMLERAGYRTARIGRSVHVSPKEQYQFGLTLPSVNGRATLQRRLYGRDVVRCAADARKFIEADDERPFFLMFCTCDAHRFGTRFDDKPGRPNAFANDHTYEGVEPVHYSPDEIETPPFLNDDVATRAELAEYYQSVSRIDQGVGAMIDVLKDAGHWDDTLFIFISDHGMSFPGAKTTVYEPGLRCPCIVYSPLAGEDGAVSDAMVSWVDITPTILDYAGATPPQARFHGRSLLPTIGHEHTEGWDEVFASHTFHEVTMYYPMRAVRTRQHKLILNLASDLEFPTAADLWDSSTWQSAVREGGPGKLGHRSIKQYLHRPRYELYDLENDPEELHNLVDDPQHEELFVQLRGKIKAFQESTDDPWLLKWTHE